jgi:hypothetical protein
MTDQAGKQRAAAAVGTEREAAVERAREEDERACSVCFVVIW